MWSPMFGGRAGGVQYFVRSISLSPLIRINSNLVCEFLVMIQSAVHKNNNFTLNNFRVISILIDFYRMFLVRSISLSSLFKIIQMLCVCSQLQAFYLSYFFLLFFTFSYFFKGFLLFPTFGWKPPTIPTFWIEKI